MTCCVVQGALRVSRFNPFEGWVGSESVGQDILITGRVDMNRYRPLRKLTHVAGIINNIDINVMSNGVVMMMSGCRPQLHLSMPD